MHLLIQYAKIYFAPYRLHLSTSGIHIGKFIIIWHFTLSYFTFNIFYHFREGREIQKLSAIRTFADLLDTEGEKAIELVLPLIQVYIFDEYIYLNVDFKVKWLKWWYHELLPASFSAVVFKKRSVKQYLNGWLDRSLKGTDDSWQKVPLLNHILIENYSSAFGVWLLKDFTFPRSVLRFWLAGGFYLYHLHDVYSLYAKICSETDSQHISKESEN